jgi:DNA-binding NtrC family response regulator
VTQTAFENPNYNVLLIDNDPEAARIVLETLAIKGIRGTVATNKKSVNDYIEQSSWDLVFLNEQEHKENHVNSFKILRRIRTYHPELPVVMLSAQDSAKLAIMALKAGCVDFAVKPLTKEFVDNIIDTFLPNHKVETLAAAEQKGKYGYRIVGSSSKLKQTVELAKRVAPTSAPVLITGESGTGKELIAELIHNESQRSEGPFVRVNCAALNDSLLESELFGHEKGAFTGAGRQHKGRFERAHGGTLLLDEITETGPGFQAKLLRVLEHMSFERVGGTEDIDVNVRVISTTNKDILKEVEDGRFRSDLYYRLAGIRLIVSALRNRKADLTELTWYFINEFASESKRCISALDDVMLEVFEKYHWPGNVRQLRNVVRTAMLLGSGRILSLSDVSWLVEELQPRCTMSNMDFSQLAGRTLQELEKRAILATLQKADGNQTKAAKTLGISDRTLRDKMKRYREKEQLQPMS